jgi:hypothetical protein
MRAASGEEARRNWVTLGSTFLLTGVPNDLAISGTSPQAKHGGRSVRCIAWLGLELGKCQNICELTYANQGRVPEISRLRPVPPSLV